MSAISDLKELMDRFYQKFDRTENGCWEWHASMLPNGYGAIQYHRQKTGAHRVSWIIHYGEIPSGLFICHKCDNKKCVNPEHLFLGTAKDNARDRANKGRSFRPIGELNSQIKMIGSRRTEALREFRISLETVDVVAKKHGVSTAWFYKQDVRRGKAKGERNCTAKLTNKDIGDIRSLFLNGRSVASIARQYNVAWPTIDRIKKGKGWKHV